MSFPLGGRFGHVMVYDSQRGVVVLFGGVHMSTLRNDTWTYDGASWTQGAPAPPPLAPRWHAAMTFDMPRGRTVLFGGEDFVSRYGDTWEHDGAAWTPGGAAPPGLVARSGHGMAFHRNAAMSVMFGGSGASGPLSDTWLYDGSWRQGAAPPAGLTGRAFFAMAWDDGRAVVVLHGGVAAGNTVLDETWMHDGTGWVSGGSCPESPARWVTVMESGGPQRLVLFGGIDDQSSFPAGAWEYDGSCWVEQYSAAQPEERNQAAMAFDDARQRLVMLGGWDAPGWTWEYRACPSLAISPSVLPDAMAGAPYSQTLTGAGGAAPYTFAVVRDSVPPGMTLSPSGTMAGTPASGGSWSFHVSITESGGCERSQPYAMFVCEMSLSPSTLPSPVLGLPYAATVSAAGGRSPYTYDVQSGALPPGLALRPATGAIGGVPTLRGTFPFTLRATDTSGCTESSNYQVYVACVVVAGMPPRGNVGIPYSFAMPVTGATPPFTFASSGGLPPGLALDGVSGEVRGVPTTAGSFPFDVSVTDAAGCTEVVPFVIDIVDIVDHLVGEGLGLPNGNEVRIHDAAGAPSPVSFPAYGGGAWGTTVAGGDLDGGGRSEILTGPGPGPSYGPHLRAWDRAGAPLAKVSFFAYGTLKHGLNPGAAALDTDGFEEVLTGPGPGISFGPHLRAFNYDGLAVTAIQKVSFFAFSTLRYGVNLASSDLDMDGFDEMLASPGAGRIFPGQVRGFDYDATAVVPMNKVNFLAFSSFYGTNIAGRDVDGDGRGEIVAARGSDPAFGSDVQGFDYAGTITLLPGCSATPFVTTYGARVGTGDLGGTGRDAIDVGAGPDPAAIATVAPYRYESQTMVALPTFLPFSGGYGVNVATGAYGY